MADLIRSADAAIVLHESATSPLQGEMLDFDGLNEVIGTPELMARGQRFAA